MGYIRMSHYFKIHIAKHLYALPRDTKSPMRLIFQYPSIFMFKNKRKVNKIQLASNY